jgi:hypothetical protein
MRGAFPSAGPPVTDTTFRRRRDRRSLSSVGFRDQGASGVHRPGYLPPVTVGWQADDNPGPVGMCLSLGGHSCSVCQPLIAPNPLVGHRPDQWHPHDHVLVGTVQFDV